jgi:hypothetical protein
MNYFISILKPIQSYIELPPLQKVLWERIDCGGLMF